jgi:polar amino acid transport system substrate-binding protein
MAAVAIVAALFICCSRNGSNGSNGFGGAKVFASLADFRGARIGSEAGTVFTQFIDRVIPNVEHKHYLSFEEIVNALHVGNVDAVCLDVPVALYLAVRDSGVAVFPYFISVDNYGFAVPKGSRLCDTGNKALRKIREDGAVDGAEMYWFAAEYGKDKPMPLLNYRSGFDGTAGTIRYGCENTLFPMAYAAPDGGTIGFDMDILYRIAYELNMNVTVMTMPFRELLPALLSGRLDMAGGSMTITDERLKSVDFVGPYFEGGTALVVRKENMPKI